MFIAAIITMVAFLVDFAWTYFCDSGGINAIVMCFSMQNVDQWVQGCIKAKRALIHPWWVYLWHFALKWVNFEQNCSKYKKLSEFHIFQFHVTDANVMLTACVSIRGHAVQTEPARHVQWDRKLCIIYGATKSKVGAWTILRL